MHDSPQHAAPETELTRREFVATTLCDGLALAANPANAQTPLTKAAGLKSEDINIPVSDGQSPAYYSMPGKGGPFPVVLVVSEVFGVQEHIKDICWRSPRISFTGTGTCPRWKTFRRFSK